MQVLPGIGDMIFFLPFIHTLAKHETDPLTLLSKRSSLPEQIFLADSSISKILILDRHSGEGQHDGFTGFFRLVRLLREHRFKKVWLTHQSLKYVLATFLAGIPVRVGFGFKRNLLLTQSISLPSRQPWSSLCEKPSRLLKAANLTPVEYEPVLSISLNATESIQKKYVVMKKPWIALGIGSSEEVKKWTTHNFTALILELSKRFKGTFFLLGGTMDTKPAQEISEFTQSNSVVIATDNHLKDSIALIAQCELFIGNDSGLLNVACALKIPAIGLFGATPPLTGYTMLRAVHPSDQALKMQGITVEDVLRAIP